MAKQTIDLDVDVTLPQVPVKIGGEERHLCFDMASVARVESLTGLNLFNEILQAPSASATAALLYASLLRWQPDLKLEQVMGWVTLKNRFLIIEAVREAWIESTPEPEAASEGEAVTQAQP